MFIYCLDVLLFVSRCSFHTNKTHFSLETNFSPHIYTIELGGAGGNPLLSRRFATEGSTEASSSPLGVGG